MEIITHLPCKKAVGCCGADVWCVNCNWDGKFESEKPRCNVYEFGGVVLKSEGGLIVGPATTRLGLGLLSFKLKLSAKLIL